MSRGIFLLPREARFPRGLRAPFAVREIDRAERQRRWIYNVVQRCIQAGYVQHIVGAIFARPRAYRKTNNAKVLIAPDPVERVVATPRIVKYTHSSFPLHRGKGGEGVRAITPPTSLASRSRILEDRDRCDMKCRIGFALEVRAREYGESGRQEAIVTLLSNGCKLAQLSIITV